MSLEESIIILYYKLEETTNLPDTLQVTEERQFRERGLIHISDEAYKFLSWRKESFSTELANDDETKGYDGGCKDSTEKWRGVERKVGRVFQY